MDQVVQKRSWTKPQITQRSLDQTQRATGGMHDAVSDDS
jgi:hypothetical protein